MKIEESNITKILLSDLDGIDPITLYVEDYEAGKGKITIECYGETWSYFWGGMSGQNISEFFISTNTSYLLNCLWDHNNLSSEPDLESIQGKVRKWVLTSRREEIISKEVAREFYEIDNWEDYAPEHVYDHWKCPSSVDKDEFSHLSFLHDEELPEKPTHKYKYLERIIIAIKKAFSQLER